MKASELMEQLIDLSEEKADDTVDTCKAGDPNREIQKVAVMLHRHPFPSFGRPMRGAQTC